MPTKHLDVTDAAQDLSTAFGYVSGNEYAIHNTSDRIVCLHEGPQTPTDAERDGAEKIHPEEKVVIRAIAAESVWVFVEPGSEEIARVSGWGP